MRLSILLAALPVALATVVTKRDEPAPLHISGAPGARLIANKYIVKFKEDADMKMVENAMGKLKTNADHTFLDVFKGFAARLEQKEVDALRNLPAVDYIEQDSRVSADSYVTQKFPKGNPQWALSYMSSRKPRNDTYVYHSSAGKGTCSYVIDSGIDDKHPDFEGRATRVKSFVPNQETDVYGHGTSTGGVLGSKTYGVAKKTKLYAIKVLDSEGEGDSSTFIAGMDYVSTDVPTRHCPYGIVINISLGFDPSPAINDAVAALAKKGYFVAVSAGNGNTDVTNRSPASEKSVCTVGASDANYERASFSNFGAGVDIMAPGVDVMSLMPNNEYASHGGTSMSAPLVAGLAAYLAALEKRKAGPHLCSRIQKLGLKNKLTNQVPGTVNIIAFNGNPRQY